MLEATRDIKEGEYVIIDQAFVVVPNDKPVCLGCLANLPSSEMKSTEDSIPNVFCSECKFPLCGKPDCDSDKWHSRYECVALKTANAADKLFKNTPQYNGGTSEESGLSPAMRVNQFYHVIAILRLILAQQNCTGAVKQQMEMLMDHNETRFNFLK